MKLQFLRRVKMKSLLKKSFACLLLLLLGAFLGIYLQRNDSIKIYINSLLEEGILSYARSTDFNDVGNSKVNLLEVRSIELSRDSDTYDTEIDSKYILRKREFNQARAAIILIDIWDTSKEPNDGFKERHESFVLNKIVPLINLARKHKIQVIHSPHSYPISKHVLIEPQDIVLEVDNLPFQMQSLYLHNLLKERGISTLLYAGNSTHKCLFDRPDGIYGMRKLMDDFILVRDATMAFEYHTTLEGELVKNVFTNYIEESYGTSTTINDLNMSLSSPESP